MPTITKPLGKLDESAIPELSDDALVTAKNIDYSSYPTISKRPGITKLATEADYAPLKIIPTALGITVQPDLASTNYTHKDLPGTLTALKEVPFGRVRRRQIFQDIWVEMTRGNVAYSSAGFFVFAYVMTPPSAATTGPMFFRVEDESGNVVLAGTISYSTTTNTTIKVACAADGTEAIIVWDDNGDLKVQGITFSAGTATLGGQFTFMASGGGDSYSTTRPTLGVYAVNTTMATTLSRKYLVCWIDTGGDWNIGKLNSSGSFTSVKTSGGGAPNYLGIAIRPADTGNRLWIVVHDAATAIIKAHLYDVSTATYVFSSTSVDTVVPAADANNGFSICPDSTGGWAMVAWKGTAGDDKLSWCQVTSAGVAGTIGRALRLTPLGDLIYIAHEWVMLSKDLITDTNYVISLRESGSVNAQAPRLLAEVAKEVAGADIFDWACVSKKGSRHVFWAQMASRRGTYQRMGLELLQFSVDRRRFQNVRFGEKTYAASGALIEHDGRYAFENNFAMRPYFISISQNVAGNTVPAGSWEYVAVYEALDRLGHLHQSEPSDAAAITVVGGTDADISVKVAPCVLTHRQTQTIVASASTTDADLYATQAMIAIYRRQVDGDGIFYRCVPFGLKSGSPYPATTLKNDTVATTAPTFVDNDTGYFSTAFPTLYTTGGRLEEDHIPGGCTCLTVHKNRLWTGGGEFGFELYYSQELEDGKPACFNLAQKVELPGLDVLMLGSLDDALIIGDRSGIYAIFGEGPNRTGNTQAGSFTLPVRIHSETGAINNVSLNHALGVFFVGRKGLYLLNRSRQVELASLAIENTLVTTPHINAIAHHESRDQIYVLLHDTEEPTDATAAVVAVYDARYKVWSTWHHTHTGGKLIDIAYFDGTMYYLDRGGNLYSENTTYGDDGVWYGITLATAQIGFGDPLGEKRLNKIRVLGKNRTIAQSGGWRAEVTTYGGARSAAVVSSHSLTDLMWASDGSQHPQITLPNAQGERFSITLTELSDGGGPTQGYEISAIGCEVEGTGRLDPAAAARSK